MTSDEYLVPVKCVDCGETVHVRADQVKPVAARCNSCKDHKGLYKTSLFAKTKGTCAYCGRTLSAVTFHREHVIPRSRGGPALADNVVASCKSCNSRKNTKDLAEFRQWIVDGGTQSELIARRHEELIDFYDWASPMMPREDVAELGLLLEKMLESTVAFFARLQQSTVTFELEKQGVKLLFDGKLKGQGDG